MKNKNKKYWVVKCLSCGTKPDLDTSNFIICNIDQDAEFIRVPSFICGKCSSVCTVELKEDDSKD